MTLETDNSAFKMWAQGVIDQLKELRTLTDTGLRDIRSAITRLALTDAEIARLKLDVAVVREAATQLKQRVTVLENAEIARSAKLDTIQALNKWMVGLMTAILIGLAVAFFRSQLGI